MVRVPGGEVPSLPPASTVAIDSEATVAASASQAAAAAARTQAGTDPLAEARARAGPSGWSLVEPHWQAAAAPSRLVTRSPSPAVAAPRPRLGFD